MGKKYYYALMQIKMSTVATWHQDSHYQTYSYHVLWNLPWEDKFRTHTFVVLGRYPPYLVVHDSSKGMPCATLTGTESATTGYSYSKYQQLLSSAANTPPLLALSPTVSLVRSHGFATNTVHP